MSIKHKKLIRQQNATALKLWSRQNVKDTRCNFQIMELITLYRTTIKKRKFLHYMDIMFEVFHEKGMKYGE